MGSAKPGKPSTTGKYAVPPEIRALKPTNISCLVKKIDGGYYVYEHIRVDDPKNPGKKKNATGKYLGVIADGKFISNESNTDDIMLDDPDNLSYGAYAIALACSGDLLDKLKEVFSEHDSQMIYVIAIIYFVNHYIPARDLQECYIQSYLCQKYTRVTLSEDIAGKFIHALGGQSKKRLRFEQKLINEGSGKYNIDGHVILCCSENNELADYGSKYSELGNTQANFMMVFDAKKKRPVSCVAFEGGISDKTEVKDVIESHEFKQSRFRIDSGFYSELNMELFRRNSCIFTIPVPGTTKVKKTLLLHMTFESSFVHERKDVHGKTVYSSVQYKEYTMGVIEETAIEDEAAAAENKRLAYEAQLKPGETSTKKFPPKKVERTEYPKDRVIMFKDQLMHDKLTYDYRKCIGDGKHTEEELEKLEPQFGVIVLRTNDPNATPQEVYVEYKDRWPIETYYDYVENGLKLKALHGQDYSTQQGIGFLSVVEGQIYSEVTNKISNCSSPYVRNMSVDECIRIAGRLRIAQHPDNTWHTNSIKGKIVDMFTYFNVDVEKDIKELNKAAKA